MSPEETAAIDAELKAWRQGDVILTDIWRSVHVAHMGSPGTQASEDLAADLETAGEPLDLQVVAVDAPGFMLVSQTCDIVRSCAHRPYVEVCPLQPIPADKVAHVRGGRMTRYLWSPALGADLLAADLDHVTTLEKAALVRFAADRTPINGTDAEARALASALGRKRSRAALPDDFVALMQPLQSRISEKHNKLTEEGAFLRAMAEIRVQPLQGWAAELVDVELFLILDPAAAVPEKADERLDALLKLVKASGRFQSVEARIVTLDSITAATYVASDRLDLEGLSEGG